MEAIARCRAEQAEALAYLAAHPGDFGALNSVGFGCTITSWGTLFGLIRRESSSCWASTGLRSYRGPRPYPHRRGDSMNLKHGLSGTPEFWIWCDIIKRCENYRSISYRNYGGRGIGIFPGWRNDFRSFLDHVGPRPTPTHSIDRIDNERGYEPGNVRWATRSQQSLNTRRNRLLSFNGEILPAMAWAEKVKIPYRSIISRLEAGWSDERTLTEPSKTYGSRFNKRNSRLISWRGETRALAEWSILTGFPVHVIKYRLDAGWTPEKAFTTAKQKYERGRAC
jgi:hypothetical protein